jgi:hypothetical protein
MIVWALLVTFADHSKISLYKTEAECKKYLPIAIEEFKKDKTVKEISCVKGNLDQDVEKEGDSSEVNI